VGLPHIIYSILVDNSLVCGLSRYVVQPTLPTSITSLRTRRTLHLMTSAVGMKTLDLCSTHPGGVCQDTSDTAWEWPWYCNNTFLTYIAVVVSFFKDSDNALFCIRSVHVVYIFIFWGYNSIFPIVFCMFSGCKDCCQCYGITNYFNNRQT